MTTHQIRIMQHELQELYDLQRDVSQKERRIEELKSDIKALLIAKLPIEEGLFYAKLVTKTVHHVAWRQAVVDNLGFEFAESIRKASPTSVICDVMVEEHGELPLWKKTAGTSGSEV
jgi:nitrogenase subunit NifH